MTIRGNPGNGRQLKTSRIVNNFFKVLLWSAAGITIAVLLFIIGYVLFRGFYRNNAYTYSVTSLREKDAALDYKDVPAEKGYESVTFIVNGNVRIEELSNRLVQLFYNGEEFNWADYSFQDQDVVPFVLRGEPAFNNAAAALLLGPEEKFSPDVRFVGTPEQMIEQVGSTPGALGYIPSAVKFETGKSVKAVSLRRMSVAVNPGVLALKDNRKLNYLEEPVLERIFKGSISNWNEIGGLDLPLRLVLYAGNDENYNRLFALQFGETYNPPDNALITATEEEFFNRLMTTEGAVGLVRFTDAAKHKLPVADIRRWESGLNLNLRFIFEKPRMAGKAGGISSVIWNTLMLVMLTLLISTPLGVFAAIYLVEYAKQGKLMSMLRLGTETLAGIPSIIFGLFGYIFFVQVLKIGIGLLAGTLTITIMILPTLIRTTEEALKTVPDGYREGSLAMGATKWQTIRKVVLPAASPGIVTGIILGIGRTVGETAALLFTMGSGYQLFKSLSSSGRSLALHLYFMVSEGISFDRAFSTGAVLVFIIIIINFTTTSLLGRMRRMAGK